MDSTIQLVYNVGMKRQPLLGTLEQLVLLAVLRSGDEAYPPRVITLLQQATGRAPSRGAVYVTLDRLEDKRLLASQRQPAADGRGGRPRRLLRVTEAGLRSLRATRDSLSTLWVGLELPGVD